LNCSFIDKKGEIMAAKRKKNMKSGSKSSKKKKVSAKGRGAAKKAAKRSDENRQDIVTLVLNDHKPLKQLIKVMKSEKAEFSEKKKAFEEFAPLLTAHAKPEEEALYSYLKKVKDLREEGFEGQVEHGLADQMVEEIKRSKDKELTAAQIKVLAELVEHHIEEEEETILPDFKKETNLEDRVDIGQRYLELKNEIEAEGSDDAPSERNIERSHYHM
jgi:hemerythrin superfamily protein